jgi:hypothetical protein
VAMPRRDRENAFLEAAGLDGIDLMRYKQSWLNQHGYFDSQTKLRPLLICIPTSGEDGKAEFERSRLRILKALY